METKTKIGIIGCGNIFPAYVKGCRDFPILEIAAIADIDLARAQSRAAEFNIPKAYSVAELLADPEIEIVINLTIPKTHAEVSLAIIAAGKHVYSEKPLAALHQDGDVVMNAAREKGLRVGCAPDTFLGGGIQTARKLIDEGAIGTPVAATAFMMSHGPESWHPNPDFYYQPGGGPLLDMGPYYLTALVNLLGPVRRVTGSARASFAERTATSKELNGHKIKVEVNTHVVGVLDFAAGAVGTLITTFDVWGAKLPFIEIYGSEGSISVPDPNTFGGVVLLRLAGEREWTEMPLTHSSKVGRGIGVADMAYGLRYGRDHRASGALANHALDIMYSIEKASHEGRHIELTSGCPQPAALPTSLKFGELDTA